MNTDRVEQYQTWCIESLRGAFRDYTTKGLATSVAGVRDFLLTVAERCAVAGFEEALNGLLVTADACRQFEERLWAEKDAERNPGNE